MQYDIPFETQKDVEEEKPLEGFALIRYGIISRVFENVIKQYGSITEDSLRKFDMKNEINIYRNKDDAKEIANWINRLSENEIVSVVDGNGDTAGKTYVIKLISKS
jgi:hypothetical protein